MSIPYELLKKLTRIHESAYLTKNNFQGEIDPLVIIINLEHNQPISFRSRKLFLEDKEKLLSVLLDQLLAKRYLFFDYRK